MPITFNASCGGGTAVTQYSWAVTPSSAVATINPTTAAGLQTLTFSAAATLTVTPRDISGNAGPQQQAFISGGGGGGGGGGFAGTCPGYAKTLVKNFDWATPGNLLIDTVTIGGVGSNGVLVASFTTPATPGYDGALLNVGVAEFPGDQQLASRTIAVSEGAPACDLTAGIGFVKSLPSTGSMYLAYGVAGPFGYGVLKPNTTYYIVVANKGRGGVPSCTTGRCDFRLEIGKPPGI